MADNVDNNSPQAPTDAPLWKPKNEEERTAYYRERVLNQMHLTEADFTMELYYEGRHGSRCATQCKIFAPSKYGGVDITVYDLARNIIEFEKPNLTDAQAQSGLPINCSYIVERINPKRVDDSKKYNFPKGQGVHPFFPPKLVKKYEDKETIPMLILTEGYFKAMCASMYGFDIVGLGSITHYAETGTRRLHKDIRRLIDTCHVASVVILYDGDCLNISEKDLERREELTRRPHGFYQALLNTRALLREMDVNVYFAHVMTDELNVTDPPKGLDDLLLHPMFAEKRQLILEDLEGLGHRGEYFYKDNITAKTSKLQDYFYLRNVEQFYKQWSNQIGEKEFMYYGSVYKFDPTRHILDRIVPRELRNFLRAGDDYYEKVMEPSPLNCDTLELKIKPRRKGTIIDDFGREALKQIPRYKGFVYIARHKDYQQIIHNFYNRYFPLRWHEENVPFPHIKNFMKHIFGPNEDGNDDQLELGYDYMQLLYQKPSQILPILCPVSKERNTGKTTLLLLLRMIFGDNVALIDNDTMNSEFNSLFAGKLIVAVDESSFQDNTRITEKLKNLSTSRTMSLNEKGKDQQIVGNFAKFILTANDVSQFVKTDKAEIRFWVRELTPIKKSEIIPDIIPIFEDEIPGFLYFLNNRKMSVPTAITRMWFTREQIHTSALDRLVNDNRPPLAKAMGAAFSKLFVDFPAKSYIVTVRIVIQLAELNEKTSADLIREYLMEYFLAEKARNAKGIHASKYVKVPYYEDQKQKFRTNKDRGYILYAENILEPDELQYVNDVCATRKRDTQQTIEDIREDLEEDANYIPRGNE